MNQIVSLMFYLCAAFTSTPHQEGAALHHPVLRSSCHPVSSKPAQGKTGIGGKYYKKGRLLRYNKFFYRRIIQVQTCNKAVYTALVSLGFLLNVPLATELM